MASLRFDDGESPFWRCLAVFHTPCQLIDRLHSTRAATRGRGGNAQLVIHVQKNTLEKMKMHKFVTLCKGQKCGGKLKINLHWLTSVDETTQHRVTLQHGSQTRTVLQEYSTPAYTHRTPHTGILTPHTLHRHNRATLNYKVMWSKNSNRIIMMKMKCLAWHDDGWSTSHCVARCRAIQ